MPRPWQYGSFHFRSARERTWTGRAWSRDDCGVLGAAGGSPKYDGRVVRYEERSPVKNIISFPVDAPDSSELRLGAAVAAAARNIPFEEVLSDRLKRGLPV